MMDTETIDRLYLEWSQFTEARTAREISLQAQVAAIVAMSGSPNQEALAKLVAELNTAAGDVQSIMARNSGEVIGIILRLLLTLNDVTAKSK